MSQTFDLHWYDDIIDLPHHTSPNRPRMSNIERGAQFSPFAALTGYGSAVREAARSTDKETELSEDAQTLLDAKLRILSKHLCDEPQMTVTYFVPDERKDGGCYTCVSGTVKDIDMYERCMIMSDDRKIPLDTIRNIEGDFSQYFDEE